MRPNPRLASALVCSLVLLLGTVPAWSGVHLWRVTEIFSNPDGTIQFIEIGTCCGSTTENFLAGQVLRSNTNSFTFPANVAGSTLNKHVLLATSAFAALPGAPPPDHIFIVPNNFFSTTSDTITFAIYDFLTFSAGQLPTDGTASLNKDPNDVGHAGFMATNSPTNYAGQTGSVSASPGPPGVPDGTGGTTPLTATPLNLDGSSLRLSFDARACTGAAENHILFGERRGFPAAPGGIYTPAGSVCRIGTASPFDWINTPRPADGSSLIWFLVVATDSSGVEGSWGVDSGNRERTGPGNNGASGTCAVVKSFTNTCGHVSQ